jgi:uncharacterized membrane protein
VSSHDTQKPPAWSEGGELRERKVDLKLVTASILLLSSAAAMWLTVLDVNGTVRLVVLLVFALTAPGWAVTAFFLPLEPAIEWTLAVTLSIAISTILSMLMLISNHWIPVPAMLGLACVVGGLLIFHISVMSRTEPMRVSAEEPGPP